MKVAGIVVVVAIACFGLVLPAVAVSDTSALMPTTIGNVTYLSGGIGEEAAMMRSIAKDYQLEVVFVQKQKQREEHLAEVKVQIQDQHQNTALEITTDGPYLLANLPQGKYLVIAEYGGEVKRQLVHIDLKKHQKIVFLWPIRE